MARSENCEGGINISYKKKKAQKALEEAYEKPEKTVISIRDIGLPRQLLLLVKEIYNHPQTNDHTRDLIRFQLKKLLGEEYDIKEFLRK
jgi:hypothetical protein